MTDPDGWKTNKLAEEQTLWKGRARGARGRPSTAQLGLAEFPAEAKLAVDQNDDSEDARALRRKRRVAKPIQAFDHERRRHNAQLAAQRLATLSEEEFIGARLYTGAC